MNDIRHEATQGAAAIERVAAPRSREEVRAEGRAAARSTKLNNDLIGG